VRVHSTRSTPSRAPSRALARRRTDVAVIHLFLSLSRFLPTLSPASSRAPTDARDDENRRTTTRETTPPPPRARLPPRVDADASSTTGARARRPEHTECPNTHTHADTLRETFTTAPRVSTSPIVPRARATSGGSVERARDDDDDSPRDRSLDAVDRSTDRPTKPTDETDRRNRRSRARAVDSIRFDSIRSIDRRLSIGAGSTARGRRNRRRGSEDAI